MPIEVREDPAATYPIKQTFKPTRLLGWFVIDTDAPMEVQYLNTDGIWRGCCARGWWRTREEAEEAAERERRKQPHHRVRAWTIPEVEGGTNVGTN